MPKFEEEFQLWHHMLLLEDLTLTSGGSFVIKSTVLKTLSGFCALTYLWWQLCYEVHSLEDPFGIPYKHSLPVVVLL